MPVLIFIAGAITLVLICNVLAAIYGLPGKTDRSYSYVEHTHRTITVDWTPAIHALSEAFLLLVIAACVIALFLVLTSFLETVWKKRPIVIAPPRSEPPLLNAREVHRGALLPAPTTKAIPAPAKDNPFKKWNK